MRRTVRWLILAALGVVAFFALLTLVSPMIPLTSTTVSARIVQFLSDRLDSDVTLDDIHWQVFPRLRAEGHGLVIRQRGQQDAPPLISIRTFSVRASVIGLARRHVDHVTVQGLEIQVPPDRDRAEERDHAGTPPGARATTGSTTSSDTSDSQSIARTVVIDTLETDDARLIIVPAKRDKAPKTWAIHKLRMRGLGVGRAMPYEATLTNAVPPGEIETSGSFGPWKNDNPGGTPLNGNFTFARADLGVFKGISGTLSSTGSFGGSLGWIDVNGETDTPDFVISVGGHPFPLHTNYHAIVDGTNGDTILEKIDATFLESTLVARGSVLDGPPGERGRTVTLDITMPKARIEDVMTMAVKTPKPPMTGALQLTTKFLLPPGEGDVADRLKLDGRFSIARARFANIDVQAKINELSRRGRGKQPEEAKESVVSNMQGRFLLGNGKLVLPSLSFGVPGAEVRLAGHYSLKRETLAFKGNLLMDAKISETQSGWKAFLLKAIDPLFKKPGGGSSVPIKIEGSRNDPKFGLDVGRVFKRGN